MNFYPHHIGDYDSHTAHLSWLEDAAYRRLVCLYYRTEKPLPIDRGAIARLIRAASKPERQAIVVVLDEFFHLEDDGWHNDRCDREIAKMQAKAERNREVGKKGGRPKKVETQTEPTNNPDGFLNEPTSNPTQDPIANTQDPEKKEPVAAASSLQAAIPSAPTAAPPDAGARILALLGNPPHLLNTGRVGTWLRAGYDLEADILPAVAERLAKKRKTEPEWLPNGLDYFDGAVADAHARRTKPLPEGVVPSIPPVLDRSQPWFDKWGNFDAGKYAAWKAEQPKEAATA